MPVIEKLEMEHTKGHERLRELQHLLLAWELLGDSHRQQFADAMLDYVSLYLNHMKTEETQLLPVAGRCLTAAERAQLDTAFQANCDPLGPGSRDKSYERLFTRIVLHAPGPIGVGRG
jgi:hemerythrin-like domain-containing protein